MSQDENKIDIASAEEVAKFAPAASTEADAPAVATEAGASDDVTALHARVAELQDKFLRAKAEAQNVVRRAQQERIDAVRYGNAELLRTLLSVVDDVDRTQAAAAGATQIETVRTAVQLIHEKLLKLLKDNEVEALETVGRPFDPAEHAALLQQASDTYAPGTVLQEVQRGYRYRDRILRPAQVIVAQAPPASEDAAE